MSVLFLVALLLTRGADETPLDLNASDSSSVSLEVEKQEVPDTTTRELHV